MVLREHDIEGSDKGRVARRALIFLLLIGVAAIFAGGAVYVNRDTTRHIASDGIPLIRADTRPTKEKPADAGGLKVPYANTLIYERVNKGKKIVVTERLLPAAEEPMAKPTSLAIVKPARAELVILAKTLPQKGLEEEKAKPIEAPMTPPVIDSDKPVEKAPVKLAPPAPTPAKEEPAGKKPTETKPPREKPVKTAPAEKAPLKAKPAAGERTQPKPAPKPKVEPKASAPKTAPGSTAIPVLDASQAANGKFGIAVQLAAYRTQVNAEAGWQRLSRRFAAELKGLKPLITRVSLQGKGVFFRLLAGGVGDAASAKKLCSALKSKNQGCIVVK